MNFPWAIRLARPDAAALAPLRLAPGIEVAEDDAGESIWVRGAKADETLASKLSALPTKERYEWLPADRLRSIEHRIPSGRLPALRWQPLAAWLRVEAPAAALPAQAPSPATLRLERSAVELDPGLLLTSFDDWHAFALDAPQVRLDRLRFAVSPGGRVLVRGTPLPPLPGRRFVLHGALAVPAGFSWQPTVSAEVVARRFGAAGDALVLWDEDGTIARLHAEQFLPAARSAVAATASVLAELE